jgi:VWFA-related protein
MRRFGGVVLGLAVVLVAMGGRGSARAAAEDRGDVTALQQAQQKVSAPTLEVYSRETVVDVIVTDQDGKPVHGLTQADFTVKEDGRDEAIRSFAEFGDGASAAAAPVDAGKPGAMFSNRGVVSGPVNVILLDGLNVPAGMLFKARRAVLDYLKAVPERSGPGGMETGALETPMAVFALTAHGLERLSGFTTDRDVLAAAVNRWANWGNARVEGWTKQWVTVHALDELAANVSKVHGRKNLIWFTPAMPVMLLRDGGYGWGSGDMAVVHMLMDAYELLSRAEVSVSPVDPSGVSVKLGSRQMLMEQVAAQSGGTAYYNSNALGGMLKKALDGGRQFYTLSYVPPRTKDDGRYHTIHVEVDRPGLKLVYRTGYDAEDPLAEHAIAPGPGLKQAVEKGKALEGTEVLFDVAVEPSPDAARQVLVGGKPQAMARYNLVYSVPADEISPMTEGKPAGSIRFQVQAFQANGKPMNVVAEQVTVPPLLSAHGEAVTTPFRFTQQLDLPEGKYLLDVMVVNEESKIAGRMEIPLTVVVGGGMAAGK